MEFECRSEKGTWNGIFKNLSVHGGYFEVDVSGRGSSFHIIAGRYEYGGFLCIPGWRVGCEIAGYQDSFWNYEQLEGLMGTVDAMTVVTAIRRISYLLEDAAEIG